MEWMLLPLKRYADFNGRSRRKEYWMFILFQVLTTVAFVFLIAATGNFDGEADGISGITLFPIALLIIFYLGIFIPSLAVQVRRLHDTDRSGWWILLGLIPIVNYIGSIVLLVFYCLEGTKGENQFGPDPKMGNNVGDIFE